ncbi:hypothetical protein CR513_31037, partial [Mucuna pruriens]
MGKCKIPPFLGNCKPEVYLDWELKVEQILGCFEYNGKAAMARFLHGLNREIQDIVELKHYSIVEELVYQAIKVELQIKRRNASRKPYSGSSSWKDKEKEKYRSRTDESLKKGSEIS